MKRFSEMQVYLGSHRDGQKCWLRGRTPGIDSGGGRHEVDVAPRPAAAAGAEFVPLPFGVPQEKRTPECWRKCF